MRLLFVDVRAVHLNPTATLLPRLFASLPQRVDFWGPGHVDLATLRLGLRSWVERQGPYDMVVAGAAMPMLVDELEPGVDAAAAALARNAVQSSDVATLAACFRDVHAAFDRVPVPHRAVSTLNFDCYAASSRQIDRVCGGDWMLLGPDESFTSRLSELPDYARQETHYARKAARLSDAWKAMLEARRHRQLSALHFVAPEELCSRPLSQRPHRVAVPGVAYLLRREAADALRRHGLSTAGTLAPRLIRAAAAAGLPVFRWPRWLAAYHRGFRRTLERTRVVYTARGGFGLPVRKFFEIPAAGAVMACTPCVGMSELGFRDGVHHAEVAPDALPGWLQARGNAESLQAMADAGRELVSRLHSLQARAGQLSACLDRVAKGNFHGSRWRDGRFELLERS